MRTKKLEIPSFHSRNYYYLIKNKSKCKICFLYNLSFYLHGILCGYFFLLHLQHVRKHRILEKTYTNIPEI